MDVASSIPSPQIPGATKSTGGTGGGVQRSNQGVPLHKGSSKQQEAIDYAWQISKDPNFIYLLKAENGKISIDRKSDIVGSNGYRDYGYCQINKGFHPKIVKDSRFFTDMRWQLDQCYRLYKGGTTFYGLTKFKSNKAFQSKVKEAFDWV
jgi:hypothetical protein